jgi:SNF2 family DNA or RNA helicase
MTGPKQVEPVERDRERELAECFVFRLRDNEPFQPYVVELTKMLVFYRQGILEEFREKVAKLIECSELGEEEIIYTHDLANEIRKLKI